MKIGIMTFYNGINYGGTLQCLATQSVLQELGHEVLIINYKATKRRGFLKKNLDRLVSVSSFNDIKAIIEGICKKKKKGSCALNPEEIKYVRKSFDEFRQKHFNETTLVNEDTIANVANGLDCIIIGSDQIWADIHEATPVYMGGWAPRYSGRLIAYAACSPLLKIERPYKKRTTELLKRFHGISTRDTHTKRVIPDSCNVESKVVVDPTMLYNGWNIPAERLIEEKYILLYILRREISGGVKESIRLIKEKYPNRKVVSILTGETSIKRGFEGVDEFIIPTPEEWVQLIAQSDVLFTDSFHGSVFASKYSKPFISYYNENSEGKYRLIELQNILNAKNNFVRDIEELKTSLEKGIEYKMQEIEQIKDSKNWLINKLS